MAGNNIHIHLDGSPYWTVEKFAAESGIKEAAVQKRVERGELPADSFNCKDSATGRATKYINMIKLAQMAASSSYDHPRLKS